MAQSGKSPNELAVALGIQLRDLEKHMRSAEAYYLIGPKIPRLAELTGVSVAFLTGEEPMSSLDAPPTPQLEQVFGSDTNGENPPRKGGMRQQPGEPRAVIERIAQAITSSPYTATQLGEMLGVSGSMVGLWKKGSVGLYGRRLQEFAKLTRCSIPWLTGERDDDGPEPLAAPPAEEREETPVAFGEAISTILGSAAEAEAAGSDVPEPLVARVSVAELTAPWPVIEELPVAERLGRVRREMRHVLAVLDAAAEEVAALSIRAERAEQERDAARAKVAATGDELATLVTIMQERLGSLNGA